LYYGERYLRLHRCAQLPAVKKDGKLVSEAAITGEPTEPPRCQSCAVAAAPPAEACNAVYVDDVRRVTAALKQQHTPPPPLGDDKTGKPSFTRGVVS